MPDDDEELPPCIGERMRDSFDPFRRAVIESESADEQKKKAPSLHAGIPKFRALDGNHAAAA